MENKAFFLNFVNLHYYYELNKRLVNSSMCRSEGVEGIRKWKYFLHVNREVYERQGGFLVIHLHRYSLLKLLVCMVGRMHSFKMLKIHFYA